MERSSIIILLYVGMVSSDVLHNESLRITLTVPEVHVAGTEIEVTSNLPFLLDPSSIANVLVFTNRVITVIISF